MLCLSNRIPQSTRAGSNSLSKCARTATTQRNFAFIFKPAGNRLVNQYVDAEWFQPMRLNRELNKNPVEVDPTASVKAFGPFKNYQEEPLVARLHNLNQFFYRKRQSERQSYYALKFTPQKETELSLKQYVDQCDYKWFHRFSQGTVTDVQIHESYTCHIPTELDFSVRLYDPGTNVKHFTDYNNEPANGSSLRYELLEQELLKDVHGFIKERPWMRLILMLQTPGGFWDICWQSEAEGIKQPKHFAEFLELLSNTRVRVFSPLDEDHDVTSLHSEEEATEKTASSKKTAK